MLQALRTALRRTLAPLVRLAIARGFRYPEFAELLKDLYLEEADRHFRLAGRRMTDSRASILTGLQRKDIRQRRAEPAGDDGGSPQGSPQGMGPLPRVLARWATHPDWRDQDDRPLVLRRRAEAGPSFESLVGEISRDIHPRTVLDQLCAAGALRHDARTDEVTLLSDTYLARDDSHRLGYLGANLGDHAEAAAANVLADQQPAPYFERAVHYDGLTAESLEHLDGLARRAQEAVLSDLNRTARERQEGDRGRDGADGRFRCGAFVYRESPDREEAP
jgi:hypothetical protein